MSTHNTYLHIIANDDVLERHYVNHVPRVGDEIRTGDEEFWTVTRVVYVYDEPDSPYDRANILVEPVAS